MSFNSALFHKAQLSYSTYLFVQYILHTEQVKPHIIQYNIKKYNPVHLDLWNCHIYSCTPLFSLFSVELVPRDGLTSHGEKILNGVIKLFWQFVLHFITLAPANFMNIKFLLLFFALLQAHGAGSRVDSNC